MIFRANPRFLIQVNAAAKKRVGLLGALVSGEAKKNVSKQAEVIETSGGRDSKGRSTKRGRRFKGAPPGEFPRLRTGTLRSSISVERLSDGFSVAVGPSVFYGKYLEFGTRRMAARPFMRPTLAKVRKQFPTFFLGLI